MRSIRFRLSVVSSLLVFGVGGLILGATYLALWWSLQRETTVAIVTQQGLVKFGDTIVPVTTFRPQEVQTLSAAFRQFVLEKMAVYSLVALGVLLLLSILIGWIISGRTLRPVAAITEVARQISASDLSKRIDLQGPDDELTRLAGTFDGMLDRLEESFVGQRRFIADTSHDLRNPLAIIQNNVEVTLADPNSDAAQWRETGEIVLRASQRMRAMVDDLLAAARLEAGVVDWKDFDLGEVVEEVGEEVQALVKSKGLELITVPGSAPTKGDPLSLNRALANLIDNSVRHSPVGGKIRIGSGAINGWSWLAVQDQGPGLGSALARNVLDTGQQEESDVASNSPARTGLGLNIVTRVAAGHGGTVTVHDGATVVVWLGGNGQPVPVEAPLPPL